MSLGRRVMVWFAPGLLLGLGGLMFALMAWLGMTETQRATVVSAQASILALALMA